MSGTDFAALRQSLREQSTRLSAVARTHAAEWLKDSLLAVERVAAAKTVGLYQPTRIEISVAPLAMALAEQGKQIAWPVVDAQTDGRMQFVVAPARAQFHRGRCGNLEPAAGVTIERAQMDVIIVPCLGVSPGRYRLGNGGGYYDRYLGANSLSTSRPWLIGVGFAHQQVDFEPQPWDVQLDALWLAPSKPE